MNIFEVINCKRENLPNGQESRTIYYLTLGDMNSLSGNRYYVSLTGKESEIDWQAGDRLLLDLNLSAYNTQGQWQVNDSMDTIKLLEVKTE